MKPLFLMILSLLLCSSPLRADDAVHASGPPWIRDFNDGQRKARQEKKDLLVVFTGHGWCASCEILDREVFQNARFVRSGDAFVFVELDFTFRQFRLRNSSERVPIMNCRNDTWRPRFPRFPCGPAGVPYAVLEGYKRAPGRGRRSS